MIDEKIRTRARQSFSVYRRVLAVKWPMSFIGAIKGSLIRNETLKENLMIIPHQDNRENNSNPVQGTFHSESNVIFNVPNSNSKASTVCLTTNTLSFPFLLIKSRNVHVKRTDVQVYEREEIEKEIEEKKKNNRHFPSEETICQFWAMSRTQLVSDSSSTAKSSTVIAKGSSTARVLFRQRLHFDLCFNVLP